MELKAVALSLKALSHNRRLAIYRLVARSGPGGLPVGRIGTELGVAPATLSFHLRELSHARLVCATQEGRFIYYSADVAAMSRLLAFLAEHCFPGSGGSQEWQSEPALTAPRRAKPVVRPKARVA